jgi:hypothetical protein
VDRHEDLESPDPLGDRIDELAVQAGGSLANL